MQSLSKSKIKAVFPLCFLVSFVVLFCFLVGCTGEPKHPIYKNATGSEQYERLLWESIQKKDWTTVERQLSATFIGVNAQGQMFDRASWIDFLKSAQIAQFSLGEVQVQPEGPDMKVTYILNLQAGGPVSASSGLRVVSVWQQLKKGWILSATSMTPIQGAK